MDPSFGLNPELLQRLRATQQKAKEKSIAANAQSAAQPAPDEDGTAPSSSTASSLQEPDGIETPVTTAIDPNEESLFVPEDTPVPTIHYGATKRLHSDIETPLISSENDSDVEEIAPPTKKQARSARSGSRNSSFTKSKNKSTVGSKGKATSKPPKPTKKSKASSKVKKLTRQQQIKKNITSFNGLYNSNVYRDVATNQGRDEAPTFQATRKDAALKQLLASIPEECRSIARFDKKQLHEAASALEGQCRLDPVTQGWRITGMTSALSHYQMLGVSYMRKREMQEHEPRGGLLADSMGLGKTVMAIATIINGRKDGERDTGVLDTKTTLIVVTSSIIMQWQAELAKHTREADLGKVYRYNAGHKFDSGDLEQDVSRLMRYDVVLTTYSEIAKSFPKQECPVEISDEDVYNAWWLEHYELNKGIFHAARFRRVILDEAQHIKNHTSHTSKACRALDSVYRWAITATPVMNSLTEFYPYFDFLRVPDCGTYEVFQHNYRSSADDSTGRDRLHVRLSQFMIRRSHNDSLLGAKLLVLPKTAFTTYYCHFEEVEKRIYDVVKRRFAERINLIGREDSRKIHHTAFTLLLRLRQLVGHILLIQDTIRELLTQSDLDELRRILAAPVQAHSTQQSLIRHLRMMLADPGNLPVIDPAGSPGFPTARVETVPDDNSTPVDAPESTHATVEDAPDDYDFPTEGNTRIPAAAPNDDLPDMSASADSNDDLPELNTSAAPNNSFLDSSAPAGITPAFSNSDSAGTNTGRNQGQTAEPLHVGGKFGMRNSYDSFFQAIGQEQITDAHEVFVRCSKCAKQPPKDPHVTSCGHFYCNTCLKEMSYENSDQGFDHSICTEPDCRIFFSGSVPCSAEGRTVEVQLAPTSTTTPSRKKKQTVKSIIDLWVDAKGYMLPSAKTLAVKAQILNWFKEDRNGKIIIYTQFMSMMHILEKMCQMEHWGCLTYHGGHSAMQRNNIVNKFESEPETRILLASLKSGGAGLNLTMASRVILVDLWWNNGMEQQAYCRVYRRGQTKQTSMVRMAVSNTVDQDLIRIQERKDREITSVMLEGDRVRMTTNDLLSLFGTVGEENGRPFIITGL